MQQVVLVACGVESNVTAWDLRSGTQLTQYKANASGRGCFCQLGTEYLVSSQSSKDALHFWAWHKDQVIQRSFTPEPITALAGSPDGAHLAAGGAKGTLYLWEAASGRLLAMWPGHYQAVSCLAFADGGTVLLSGGQDTLVAAWSLGSCLDASAPGAARQAAGQRMTPLHTWSDHTLPVTALAVGFGGASAILASASLDHSVKIRSLGTGALLRAVVLPRGLSALALDPGEQLLYAGGVEGSIWEVPLVDPEALGLPAPAAAAAGAEPGGGPAAAVTAVLQGHTKGVNCLVISGDGELLVSGGEDGCVRVWELRSRQCLRVLSAPSKAPVTGVVVAALPAYLAAQGGPVAALAAGSGRRGPRRPQPLAQLAKFVGVPGTLKPWEGPPVILDGSAAAVNVAQASGLLPGLTKEVPLSAGLLNTPSEIMDWAAAAAGAGGAAAGVLGEQQQEEGEEGKGGAERLRQQVALLQEQLQQSKQMCQRWQALHAELYSFCTEKVLQ